jgi:hypothetical protein
MSLFPTFKTTNLNCSITMICFTKKYGPSRTFKFYENLEIYERTSFPLTHTCVTIFSYPYMTFGLTKI